MDTSQANQSSHSNDPKILESLEAFIKHLELGINDMQEKIEKNTTSTIDIIVKTAAETAAHVHRSLTTSSKNSTSVKPMHDVICNGCYRPIRGQRYLCETCDDFDLCSACKSRVNHDATHNFRYIAPIDNNPPPPKMTEQHSSDESSCSTQSRSAQNRFFCDNCDSEIVGVRHTCTSCPDFDLCNKCFYSDKYEHPERHLLITHVEDSQKMPEKTINKKAKKPSNDKAHIIQHTGVECDSCDTPIEGIRYKCGNCPNYDLCEQCEEKASLIHDENHAFVKLRRPIQSVVHMPLLPELRFLDAATAETSNTPEVVSKPEEVSYTNIPQKPLPITPEPLINASFVSDLNIPEGTVIVPKKTFIKV
ncbi:hypothetical protein EDC96DRAFT_328288 [Choanephora cucurbitarum]|nr:hypothetical protein EDC96DRAFT_328288 [Choanephora cucurbitarum]